MRSIVSPATVNTDKDDFFVWILFSQLFDPLTNKRLGFILEHKIFSQVANNVLEQEEIVRVQPCGKYIQGDPKNQQKGSIFKILLFAHFLSYKKSIIWKIHQNLTRNSIQPSDLV